LKFQLEELGTNQSSSLEKFMKAFFCLYLGQFRGYSIKYNKIKIQNSFLILKKKKKKIQIKFRNILIKKRKEKEQHCTTTTNRVPERPRDREEKKLDCNYSICLF